MPIIWLSSYPRSGNTLLRRLIHDATGWPTHSIYADANLAESERKALGHTWVNKKVWLKPSFVPKDRAAPHPYFVKSHEWPVAGDNRRAIYIARDGRDVCASYARYIEKKWGWTRDDVLDLVISGGVPFNMWSTHVFKWHAYGAKALTVKYEDLCAYPDRLLALIFDWLGLGKVQNELSMPVFGDLQREDPDFFHRGGSWWREALTDQQHERFWKLHGHAMELLNYPR